MASTEVSAMFNNFFIFECKITENFIVNRCIRRDHCDKCQGIPYPHPVKSCLLLRSWLPIALIGEPTSSGCIVHSPKLLLRSHHQRFGRCCICRPLQRCGRHWCRRRGCAYHPKSLDKLLRGTHRASMAHFSSMDGVEVHDRYVHLLRNWQSCHRCRK